VAENALAFSAQRHANLRLHFTNTSEYDHKIAKKGRLLPFLSAIFMIIQKPLHFLQNRHIIQPL
jgi:hypothetical protein